MTRRLPRYPAQRLADRVGMDLWQMFDAIGVSGRTGATIRDLGFTEQYADRAAVKLGQNAYEVWPELLDDVIADVEGVPSARVVHAFVRCLDCGRALTFHEPLLADDGSTGSMVGVCPSGHRNEMRIQVRVLDAAEEAAA